MIAFNKNYPGILNHQGVEINEFGVPLYLLDDSRIPDAVYRALQDPFRYLIGLKSGLVFVANGAVPVDETWIHFFHTDRMWAPGYREICEPNRGIDVRLDDLAWATTCDS